MAYHYTRIWYQLVATLMGVSITDYRQSIGLYNNAKFITCHCYITCIILPVCMLLLLIITMLLLKSGSLELNPGPVKTTMLKSLKVCHLNIRGLNESKLRSVKTSLSKSFDIITISETFLRKTVLNCDLQLLGLSWNN